MVSLWRGACKWLGLATSLLVWNVAAATHAGAQHPPVIAVQTGVTIDHDTVTIGDVVILRVRVHAPLGAVISFPSAVDSVGPVQALEAPVVREGGDSARAADRIATYRLSAWNTGQQRITLGNVLVQTDAGDRAVTLDLPSVFVRSVLPADSTLRIPKAARPLFEVIVPTPWWWWAIGAVAMATLIYGLWWFIERRRRSRELTSDPFADAASAFARVEELRLLEAGEAGRYAALMADVVRRYLSERVTGVSLALTTEELLRAVRESPTVTADSLRALLTSVDQVKFARAAIAGDRARALGEDAKGIVRAEHERAEALAAAEAARRERAA